MWSVAIKPTWGLIGFGFHKYSFVFKNDDTGENYPESYFYIFQILCFSASINKNYPDKYVKSEKARGKEWVFGKGC